MANISIRFKQVLEIQSSKYYLRSIVRLFVMLVMVFAAWQFINFYYYVVGNKIVNAPYRPPVSDAFLPFLGSITALKSFFATGVFDSIHPAGLTILIATLFTAWVFRRAFCSWICPIGTLVQYLGILGHLVIGRNLTIPSWLDKLFLVLKYFAAAYLLIPMFFTISSADALALLKSPNYVTSDLILFLKWVNPTIGLVSHSIIVLALCFLFKSFWCRYLCPYGAILGIFSLFSPIVLRKKTGNCVMCGKCNNVCPNKVNTKDANSFVFSTECTGCMSCVQECPKSALELKILGRYHISPLAFSVLFILVFFGAIQFAKITGHWESIISVADYKVIYTHLTGGY